MSGRIEKIFKQRNMRGALGGFVALAAYLTLVTLFYTHARINHLYSSAAGSYVRYEKARVMAVETEALTKDKASGLDVGYQTVKIKVLTGEHGGEVMSVRNTLNYTTNVNAKPGAGVIVCIDTANKNAYNVWIYSYNREPFLWALVVLFIAILCAVGRGRGLKSVLGIVFTFTGIVFLFVPMLYRGYSPAWASVSVVTVTLCVTLVLLGGFTSKTLSAILGTMSGVIMSVLFLLVALKMAHLSGFSTSEADMLIQIAGKTHMKVGELLFAAILISSLGAIMDIAISIASSVHEVCANNRNLGVKDLFNSGMNVGRDMMGTMANTLIIAFTGTSLNILVLLYSWDVKYYQLINNNMIGIYIVQAVSGSVAVILTVPLVSFFSAHLIPAMLDSHGTIRSGNPATL
jgi:uncharacterized membrane protein